MSSSNASSSQSPTSPVQAVEPPTAGANQKKQKQWNKSCDACRRGRRGCKPAESVEEPVTAKDKRERRKGEFRCKWCADRGLECTFNYVRKKPGPKVKGGGGDEDLQVVPSSTEETQRRSKIIIKLSLLNDEINTVPSSYENKLRNWELNSALLSSLLMDGLCISYGSTLRTASFISQFPKLIETWMLAGRDINSSQISNLDRAKILTYCFRGSKCSRHSVILGSSYGDMPKDLWGKRDLSQFGNARLGSVKMLAGALDDFLTNEEVEGESNAASKSGLYLFSMIISTRSNEPQICWTYGQKAVEHFFKLDEEHPKEKVWLTDQERISNFHLLLGRDAELSIAANRLPMLSDDRISQFMESANPIIPVEAYTTFKEEMAQIIPQSLKEHCEMMWASCIAIERMTCVAIFTAQALPLNLSNTLLNIMFERWQLRQKYRSLVSFSNVAPYRAVPFQDNKEMDHEPIEVDMIITPYGSECFEFSIDDMVRSSGSLFHLFRRITDLYGDGKGEASVFEDLYRKTKVEVEQQIDKIGAHFLWAIKNRKQVPMSHIGQIWFRSYDYLPGGFAYLTDWLIESDDTSFRRRMGQMEGGLAIARRMSFEGGANIDRLVAFERCLEGIEEKRDRFVMLKNLLLQQNLQNLQNLQTVATVVPVATVSAIPEGNIFSPDPDIFSAFPSVF